MKKLNILQGCIIVVIVTVLLIGLIQVLPIIRLSWFLYDDIEESDYISLDYNIIWEEYKSKEIGTYGIPIRKYYKITGIDTNEYVACLVHGAGIGAGTGPVVKKHKDFEGELTFDLSSAKLFLRAGNSANFDWRFYRETTEKQILMDIHEVIAEEIIEYIQNAESNHLEYKDFEIDGGSANIKTLRNDEHDFLQLRFSFEEYDEIYWEATIYTCEGKYYLCIRNDALGEKDAWYVPCTLGLTVMIDEVCEQYGLK